MWSGNNEASFSSSLARCWLTDFELVGMELVGDMELGWSSVMVHRAVLLPLCPYLASLAQEDSKLVFADVSVEVVKSVVQLLYKGTCTLSPEADVTKILDMMWSLGMCIMPDMLQVVTNKSSEFLPVVALCREFASKRKTNIKKKETLMEDTERVLSMSDRFFDNFPKENVHNICDVVSSDERSDSTNKDINCNLVIKTDETKYSCEECEEDFKFNRRLLNHYKVVHPEKRFPCDECDSTFPDLLCLAQHTRKVHIGVGDFPCNVCGFKSINLDKLGRHKKFHHKKSERLFTGKSVGLLKKGRCISSHKPDWQHGMKKVAKTRPRAQTGRKFNPEGNKHFNL